jgi:hypothetical protein
MGWRTPLTAEDMTPRRRGGGEEEKHEKEGHYKGEAMHFEEEMVGVTDMLQDPHPHVDIRLATSFALL